MSPKRKSADAGLPERGDEFQCPESDVGRPEPSDSKRPEIASEETRDQYGLPDSYRIRYCKLCSLSSLAPAEVTSKDTAWGDIIAWGNGTRAAPTGCFCRQVVRKPDMMLYEL